MTRLLACILPEGVGHFPQVEAPQAFNELLAKAIAALTP